MRDKTPTERLRELLDERRVKWWWSMTKGEEKRVVTWWDTLYFGVVGATDDNTAVILFSHRVTPEQAVEATLGRGTCEVECFDDGVDEGMDGEWFSYAPPTWYLSCGHEVYGTDRPCYCSTCGVRVTEVET